MKERVRNVGRHRESYRDTKPFYRTDKTLIESRMISKSSKEIKYTAIERKREHKTLSLRAEGRARSKTRRMKGWSEVCGVGMSGQMEPAR